MLGVTLARSPFQVVAISTTPTAPPPAPPRGYRDGEPKSVFKKATYSMSLECIDHLKLIAENDGMNRSQLLRFFTHYFYQLPPEERDLIYDRFSHLFDNNKK